LLWPLVELTFTTRQAAHVIILSSLMRYLWPKHKNEIINKTVGFTDSLILFASGLTWVWNSLDISRIVQSNVETSESVLKYTEHLETSRIIQIHPEQSDK
jgi:hypothetical protein